MTIIRPATNKDIPGILAVLHHNLMANKKIKDKEQLEQAGFLIHDFTVNDVETIIGEHQHHILLVAVEDNEVVGYVMSYDMKTVDLDWLPTATVLPEIRDIFTTKKVLYHRHIARIPNKKGVGKQLLQGLVREATDRDYQYILYQIVHAPYRNKISIALHEQLGFAEVGHGDEPDAGIAFGLYLKQL